MDNLARDAMLARQAKMTYGKWKALQPVVKNENTIPEGWIQCKRCGKHFKPNCNQLYCDITCQRAAYDEKVRKEKKNETKSST